MSKTKKFECKFKRIDEFMCRLATPTYDNVLGWSFCKDLAPSLFKGLRSGQSRKLVLTQTVRGIKLERAKK
mgnify:CR=1 FL=1